MTKSGRILIVADIFLKQKESRPDFIALLQDKYNERNVSVHYILPKEPCDRVSAYLTPHGFSYSVFGDWWHPVQYEKRRNIRIAWFVLKHVMSNRYDLIAFKFCSEITALIVAVALKLLGHRCGIIWHQHSGISPLGKDRFIKRHINRLRLLSVLVDKICPVYKGQERILIDRGINPEKILTLYNGTDAVRFDNRSGYTLTRKALNIPDDAIVATTIASLTPRKGIIYLLQAMRDVLTQHPSVYLLVVGDGPLKDELREDAVRLKIDAHVMFLGGRSDVPEILHLSDFFVLATLDEPFGLVNIEAMAARKPVIATQVGGIPEIVAHNVSGILVPPEDPSALSAAMMRLMADVTLRTAMGNAGRKIFEERFSVDQMVDRYLALYGNYLPGPAREH